MKNYQFLWYLIPKFYFIKYDPKETSWAYIYEWVLQIGFFQIRKMSSLKPKLTKLKTKDGNEYHILS